MPTKQPPKKQTPAQILNHVKTLFAQVNRDLEQIKKEIQQAKTDRKAVAAGLEKIQPAVEGLETRIAALKAQAIGHEQNLMDQNAKIRTIAAELQDVSEIAKKFAAELAEKKHQAKLLRESGD